MVQVPVDRIFTAAACYPMDQPGHTHTAIAVHNGRIAAVGAPGDVLALRSPRTEVVDLGNSVVLPGFIDSHSHTEQEYQWNLAPDALASCRTQAEVLEAVRARLSADAAEWVVVAGTTSSEHVWPALAQLDAVEPNRPVIVNLGARRFLLNTAALRGSGFDRDTAAPVGGTIDRDAVGDLTGVLRGRSIEQVIRRSPFGTEAGVEACLMVGMRRMLQAGVTTTQPIVRTTAAVRGYDRLRAQDRLPLRVGLLVRAWEADCDLESLLRFGITAGFGDDWLTFEGVKLSIDGAIPERGAALTEDYADAPGQRGRLRPSVAEVTDFVVRAHTGGLRCALHAKGDRALDIALDAFEEAYARCPRPLRHRLEHVGNIRPSPRNVERMARLGLTCVLNPTFLEAEGPHLLARLGPRRAARPLSARTLAEGGVEVIAASDFYGDGPVPEPMYGIATLASRVTSDGRNYGLEEAIDVWDAVRCYTSGPARLSYRGADRGMILPGFLADLTVLSADPFHTPPNELRGIEVVATVVGGEVRYAGRALG